MWLGSWLFEKTDWNTIAQQLSVRRNVEKGDHDWHSCSSCSQPFDTDTNDGKESILVFIIWLHWSAMKGELPLVSLAVCISFTTRTANPIYTTLEKFENRVYSENACIKCYPSTQSQRDGKTEQQSQRHSVWGKLMITWSSWHHCFRKALFSKCYQSTLKRNAGVFFGI